MSNKTSDIFKAIDDNNIDLFKSILESGYEYESIHDEDYNEPSCIVCRCCAEKRIEMLKILLERGADPDGYCNLLNDPYCALIFCTSWAWPEYRENIKQKCKKKMTKLLLTYGATHDFNFEEGESRAFSGNTNIYSNIEDESRKEELKKMIEKCSSVNLKPAK